MGADDVGMDERVIEMLRRPSPADLPEIRALLRKQIAERHLPGCCDTYYGLCCLLYLVGEAEDVLLIHEMKRTDFDAGCMVDRDFYQMRRSREEMLAAVTGNAKAEEAVRDAFDTPNYESPQAFEAFLRHYFGLDDALK